MTLESRKYFTVVVHHSVKTLPMGTFRNGATAIKLRSSMSPKVKRTPDIDPLKNDLNRPIQSWESTVPALESRKSFTIVAYHCAEIDPIGTFQNGATAIEFSGNYGSKSLHHWEWIVPVYDGRLLLRLLSLRFVSVLFFMRDQHSYRSSVLTVIVRYANLANCLHRARMEL
jgi:hypothetical protein